MEEAEFDKFAEEYRSMHAENIRLSGENPEYFAEYKIADVSRLLGGEGRDGVLEILDFGAGIGGSVPYFRKYFPASRVSCLDVSRKSLDIGAARFGHQADFVPFVGGRIPFDDRHFDLVYVACVLHHVPPAEHGPMLREMRRVLAVGGTLCVFEHNPYNPLTVRAVNSCPFDDNAVLIKAGQLTAKFKSAGFEQPVISYRLFFPRFLKFMRSMEPWMTGIPLGAQYCIHARKD